jgi:hypothetical protein
VREFHLYEHGDDQVWRPVRSFVLNGASSVNGSEPLSGPEPPRVR